MHCQRGGLRVQYSIRRFAGGVQSMEQAIAKAEALIEAHQYIRRFSGKVVVIKVGGSIMNAPQALESLIADVCFLAEVGMRPVLVHGGGKRITEAMQTAGLEAQFVQGRRYTDERTLGIAEHVLVNEVNKTITALIDAQGRKAMGLHSLGSCVIFGTRLFLDDGDGRRQVDVGLVGEVQWVNADLLQALIAAEVLPVIAPIARDRAGGKLNINADSVAGHVAAALKAEKLVLVSDTHGVRTGADGDQTASSLTKAQIEELVRTGVINAGMLPKVEASITALEGQVAKAHIIDGRVPHALLLEIYTNSGIGTEIVL